MERKIMDQKTNQKSKMRRRMEQTFVFKDVKGFVWFADIKDEDTRVLARDLDETFIRAERDGGDILSAADESLESGRGFLVSEVPQSSDAVLRSREEKRPPL